MSKIPAIRRRARPRAQRVNDVDWAHLLVQLVFILLLASIGAWLLIYRRLNPHDRTSSRYYRWHQLLIALIALLAILVAVVVVLSSDPGDPDNYIFLP